MTKRLQKVMSCLLLSFLGMCLLAVTSRSYGQDTNASLSGTVTDQTNAAIPDAKLSLINAATGFKSDFVSSGAGEFTFRNLTPGTYNLSVSAKGFQSTIQQGLVLSINQAARADIHLTIGAESQTVTVTGDTSLINYDNPTLEGGISPETLNDLPLTVAGAPRSSISLATMMPGVSTGGTGNAYNARINGGIATGDEALLDGATMTEGFMNQSGMVALQGDFQMSPDMVSEVKVLTANYDAQYGSSTSGQLIVVSKGGGEQFHGAGFEFLRNDALNGTPYGTPHGRKASPDKENNYGANVGGPVLLPYLHGANSRFKSYFYFNWEAIKVHGSANPPTLTIPSIKARNGDFSNFTDPKTGLLIPIYNPATGLPFPGNMISPTLEDPIAKAYLAALPTPTNSNETSNYLVPHPGQGSLVSTANVYMFRVDLSLSSSDHLYYTYWRQYSAPNLASDLPVALSTSNPANPENAPIERLNWEHTFSPVMTNHLTFGYLNRNEGYYSRNLGAKLPTIPGVANSSYLPTFNFNGGYNQLGNTFGPAQTTTRPTYALNDVLTRVIGTHTLKAGVEWRNAGGNRHNGGGQGGSFSFNSDTTGNSGVPNSGSAAASLFLGAVSSANVQFLNVPNNYPRQIGWAVHAGDNWRVNPKLTLTYGLRWDTISPSSEKGNHLSFFDPNGPNAGAIGPNGPLKGRLAFAGTKYGEASYGKSYPEKQQYNWAPRVGLAYSLDAKTVLRAGYGIYYGQAFYPGWSGGMSQDGFNLNDTITEVATASGGNTPAMYLASGFPTPATTQNISSGFDNGQSPLYRPVDGNKRPYSSQWNLTVERELPQNFFVAVSYVGTKGTHLQSQNNPINVLNPFSSSITGFTSADGLTSQLKDKFGPNDTMVDGVPVPYAGWAKQVQGCGATVAQALLPFPQYCSRFAGQNEGHGNSTYESLQGRVERHMRNGLYVLGSFTYSSLYTNASNNTQSTNNLGAANTGVISPFNLRRQSAIAADNVPFNTTIALVYDLPLGLNRRYLNSGGFTNTFVGGWQVSPIWQYNYGIPFAFNSSNCNVVPQFREGCIPGILPGAKVLLHGRNGFKPVNNGGQYINPAAFESNFTKFGYTGTGPVVTTVYGPSFQNIDMSLTKNTRITERVNFQFRTNFFNAFNNHYFINQGAQNGGVGYAFNTTVGSPNFGQWNTGAVTSPRTIQFAARIEF